MTKQEYLDKIYSSTYNGVFPSTSRDGGCLYRADKTPDCKSRCVIGLLIPDNEYCRGMDMVGGVSRLLGRYPIVQNYIPDGLTTDDLYEIQRCHDRLVNNNSWNNKIFMDNILALECFKDMLPNNYTKGE